MAIDFVTYKTISPGKPGTKSLMSKNGEKLVCVRYKYDKQNHKKIKTAEYVIKSWDKDQNHNKIPYNKIVHLRIEYGEKHLGTMVGSAGGKWNKQKKYWELPYREVKSLGLEDRIIPDSDV